MCNKKEERGFLVRKGRRYTINSKVTSSILINQLHIDLLVHYKRYISGKLLDAGCGEKPYSLLYERLVEEGTGCDVKTCVHDQQAIDVFASVDCLPFQDEAFDTILCTNVLEHVAEAGDGFRELSRCLKHEGFLILSVPFLYPLHEAPHDYYRYTFYGLRHQMEINGLEIKKAVPLGGPGFLAAVYAHLFVTKMIRFRVIQKCNCIVQKGFYHVYKKTVFKKLCRGGVEDKLHLVLSAGYFMIAKKK